MKEEKIKNLEREIENLKRIIDVLAFKVYGFNNEAYYEMKTSLFREPK